MLYEMLFNRLPFSGPKWTSLLNSDHIDALIAVIVDKHARPEIPPSCPKELSDLMQQCWKSNPEERPSIETIIERLQHIAAQWKSETDTTLSDISSLHYACAYGKVRRIRALLKSEDLIDSKLGEKQYTSLHVACNMNQLGVVFLLLQANPSIDEKDADGTFRFNITH